MPDAIVIGGGVVGASAALELARAGADVVLFERGELGSGATGAANGLVIPPLEPALVPLWRASVEAYRALGEATGVPVVLDDADVGTLILATSDEQLAVLAGAEDPLDGAALRGLEPALSDAVRGALLLPHGVRVDTAALAAALGSAAAAAGADVRRHIAVRGVRRDADGFAVATGAGALRAERLVLAAGVWTRALAGPLGHDLPIRPSRGWLMLTAPGPPLVNHLLIEAGWQDDAMPEGGPLTVGELADGRIPAAGALPAHRLVAHSAANGGVLIGGSRSPAVHEGVESAGALERIAAHACRLLPDLAGREVVATWSGLRPATPDGLPFIAPLAPNAVVCAGHGSQGILTGAGSARLAVDLLLGRPPLADPAPFRLERPPA